MEILERDRIPVTVRSVKAELGTGSPNTIHKHLVALREPKDAPRDTVSSLLSPHVLQSLDSEMAKAVRERTAQVEVMLHEANVSVEVLLKDNDSLRAEATESQVVLEATRAAFSEHSGALASLRAQLKSTADELDAARSEAEKNRQSVALRNQQLQACEERTSQLYGELQTATQELTELRRELTDSRQDTATARNTATTLQVQLASKDQLEGLLREASANSQQHQRELNEARQRLSGLEVERTSLVERLAETRQALARAEDRVQGMLNRILSAPPDSECPG
jgi:colicin import membrane protein